MRRMGASFEHHSHGRNGYGRGCRRICGLLGIIGKSRKFALHHWDRGGSVFIYLCLGRLSFACPGQAAATLYQGPTCPSQHRGHAARGRIWHLSVRKPLGYRAGRVSHSPFPFRYRAWTQYQVDLMPTQVEYHPDDGDISPASPPRLPHADGDHGARVAHLHDEVHRHARHDADWHLLHLRGGRVGPQHDVALARGAE